MGKLLSLVVLLTTMMTFVATHPVMKHFDINLKRYSGIECAGDEKIGNRTVIPGNNKCHSWDDNQAFRSYSYVWVPHYYYWEKPQRYGDCKIHVYEGWGCTERYLGWMPHANDLNLEEGGPCVGNFSDYNHAPGLAKSVRVECHQEDEWDEIPPVPFWSGPGHYAAEPPCAVQNGIASSLGAW